MPQDHPRAVLLVSNHPDTVELYAFALEHAGFSCRGIRTTAEALASARQSAPLAIVLHIHPSEDPAEVGRSLRQAAPLAALIGLFSMQLPLASLKHVLQSFDDVLLIPCSPDALVARLLTLLETKRRRQESA